MTTLTREWDRLYRAAAAPAPGSVPDHAFGDASSAAPDAGLLAADGRVRALVLALGRPADWDTLSQVWRAVQTDLDLPAPAIAVSGVDSFQLWFSLDQPVSVAQAEAFLQALRLRYLHAMAVGRITLFPQLEGGLVRHAGPVPALQADSGHWSAFVAPDLAAIFADEPWLDVQPSAEAQASVLARLLCIKPAAWGQACERLQPADTAGKTVLTTDLAPVLSPVLAAPLASAQRGLDLEPRRFLQDVLNDAGVALALRIEAAKALLSP